MSESTTSQKLVIVDGVRTPFQKEKTGFDGLGADDLGVIVTKALIARTGLDPSIISEVIFGCVGQPADAANVARVIALRAGIPHHVPAITVHRNCASGAEALTQAYEKMTAGRGEVFLVGGTESMSSYPLIYPDRTANTFRKLARAKTTGKKMKTFFSFKVKDFLSPKVSLIMGLTDPTCNLNMGQTAEVVSRESGITREQMDTFAAGSHAKVLANRDKLAEEIVPVTTRGGTVVELDNGVRDDSTPERLARLRPVFDRTAGQVTGGNSSQITDGAVAMLVMTESKAAELGLTALGSLTGYAYAGCDPERMGLGPVYAIDAAEKATGLSVDDAELVEINEAFAGQVLACLDKMTDKQFATSIGRETLVGAVPDEKLNVNGGAIALGHPVGATGARLILSSLLELKRRGSSGRALVTACVGGGQGMALWLEGNGANGTNCTNGTHNS